MNVVAKSKWDATQQIQWQYSPFNLLGWFTNLLWIAPALASIGLAQWLRGRRSAQLLVLER